MTDWPYKHFTRAEMACRCCGKAPMVPGFMEKLEALRHTFGKPMVVSSGYRCPAYNEKVSSTGLTGPHTSGAAADISVRGSDAYVLMAKAFALGFTGIGVNQKGNARFIHLDDLPNGPGCPRPFTWSY
jgi:zinc D-Ala-D-Ala carboxypeptidase